MKFYQKDTNVRTRPYHHYDNTPSVVANPEPRNHMPPRGVTPTKTLEAGGPRHRGPVHLPQDRGTSREKKLPRGRPVIPKRRRKGQTRKPGRAHKLVHKNCRPNEGYVLFCFVLPPNQSQTDLFCHVSQNNKNSSRADSSCWHSYTTYSPNRWQQLADQERMIDV
jgi:hypothetical protein